jgi:hypothetical protein
MAFPHRNPRVSNTTIFLTGTDYFFGTLLLLLAYGIAKASTSVLWYACTYVYHHWYFALCLPVFWLSLVAWLLVIILCCVIVAIGCLVYRQGWTDTKFIFSDATA